MTDRDMAPCFDRVSAHFGDRRGVKSLIASHCGVPRQSVQRWALEGIPAVYADLIEDLTQGAVPARDVVREARIRLSKS
jgi:hypothetical protein